MKRTTNKLLILSAIAGLTTMMTGCERVTFHDPHGSYGDIILDSDGYEYGDYDRYDGKKKDKWEKDKHRHQGRSVVVYHGRSHPDVPPGHMPPPGHARVWVIGKPPGQQSPPYRL